MASFRINYGNGQVSGTFEDRREAVRELARVRREDTYGGLAWLQRYHAGTADDSGDWFTEIGRKDAIQ